MNFSGLQSQEFGMEEEFEVRGHDEHMVAHHAHGGDNLAMRIAVLTAVLSTIGAAFSYTGGAAQNEAMLLKNEALLKKTAAADQWAFYETKSQKQLVTETISDLVDEKRAVALKEKAARYESEKAAIRIEAEKLDRESERLNQESEHAMHPHHRISQGMTLIQIGIALSSIAALTRRKWLVGLAAVAAAIGVSLGLVGLLA